MPSTYALPVSRWILQGLRVSCGHKLVEVGSKPGSNTTESWCVRLQGKEDPLLLNQSLEIESLLQGSAFSRACHGRGCRPPRLDLFLAGPSDRCRGGGSASGQSRLRSPPLSSPWTGRTWSTCDEVVEQSRRPLQLDEQALGRGSADPMPEPSVRSRASSGTNGHYRGCSAHRASGRMVSGRSGAPFHACWFHQLQHIEDFHFNPNPRVLEDIKGSFR